MWPNSQEDTEEILKLESQMCKRHFQTCHEYYYGYFPLISLIIVKITCVQLTNTAYKNL